MKYRDVEQVAKRWDSNELLKLDERDPCYTWLFPLALGDLDVRTIWLEHEELPRSSDNITLYVHIPFCKFVCRMCPFTHEPLSKSPNLDAYVEALCKEIMFYGNHPSAKARRVTTLYFGGGTASSLNGAQLEQVLGVLKSRFLIDTSTEITLECHPRTVDKEYLRRAKDLGVNRVSFGIQSFQQRFIDSLKLHQQVDQSRRILADALTMGFHTVAMDLMYRYASQDVTALKAELDVALDLGVHGISVYALDASVRGLKSVSDKQRSVTEEHDMYYYLHDRLLEEGFVHVAQPDYARPGHENLQLRDLWGAPQAENLSFGAGAFSESFNGVTWANVHDSRRYIEYINSGNVPILMGLKHSFDDAVARYAALGVRCLRVPTSAFKQRFGISFTELYRSELSFLVEKGWIVFDGDDIEVTRQGKFFIDNISKAFFNPRNRGKSQLWGVQLGSVEPKRLFAQSEILALAADRRHEAGRVMT